MVKYEFVPQDNDQVDLDSNRKICRKFYKVRPAQFCHFDTASFRTIFLKVCNVSHEHQSEAALEAEAKRSATKYAKEDRAIRRYQKKLQHLIDQPPVSAKVNAAFSATHRFTVSYF